MLPFHFTPLKEFAIMFAATIFEVLFEVLASVILTVVYDIADFINLLIAFFFGF